MLRPGFRRFQKMHCFRNSLCRILTFKVIVKFSIFWIYPSTSISSQYKSFDPKKKTGIEFSAGFPARTCLGMEFSSSILLGHHGNPLILAQTRVPLLNVVIAKTPNFLMVNGPHGLNGKRLNKHLEIYFLCLSSM